MSTYMMQEEFLIVEDVYKRQAFLYLDFYLYEIKNGFNKVEKEQKKALIALAWELSYVIAKHHSNFESMEAYLKNFQFKVEELLRKWKEQKNVRGQALEKSAEWSTI